MAWEDVVARLNFNVDPSWGTLFNPQLIIDPPATFTEAEQTQIKNYLSELYFGSPTARALLETLTVGTRDLKLYKTASPTAGVALDNPDGTFRGIGARRSDSAD